MTRIHFIFQGVEITLNNFIFFLKLGIGVKGTNSIVTLDPSIFQQILKFYYSINKKRK